jgi:acetone carboxylase gamma subunit
MSIVTVDSAGHVNADSEYEVPCPSCGASISFLRYAFRNIEHGDFYMDGDSPQYDDNDWLGELEFYCPECDELLFTSEKDAKRFLLSRSWEPDLLPMPL